MGLTKGHNKSNRQSTRQNGGSQDDEAEATGDDSGLAV